MKPVVKDTELVIVSPRDVEIVQLLANDHSIKEVAESMKMSVRTVETILYTLRKSFKTNSTLALVIEFFRNKLID